MPKFYDELGEASLENLASDPSNLPEGRVWKNSTSQLPKVAIGGAVKELITNDATQTLSNKTISGASNTITNVSGSNVVNTPSGNLAATDVQAALNELQSDIDTRATSSALTTHTSATTSVHGIADTADLLTTSNAKVVTNKDIDGGTASNTNRVTIPKDTLANLQALTRKEGTIVYATDTDKFYSDNGTSLVPVGAGSGLKNYFTDGDAEGSNPFTLFNDGAAIWVDGTGGSPTATITQSATTPLAGQKSFLFTSGTQYDTAKASVTIDREDKYKVIVLEVAYETASGTYADGDLQLFVYDSTNSAILYASPVSNLLASGINSKQQFAFQTSDSLSYQILIHQKTSATFSMRFEMKFSPQLSLGYAPITTDYENKGAITITATTTNPTKGTVVTDKILMAKLGQRMLARYSYSQSAAGTNGSGDILFALPSGVSFDTNLITPYSGNVGGVGAGKEWADSYVGTGWIVNDAGNRGVVTLFAYDSTHFRAIATDSFATLQQMSSSHYTFGSSTLAFEFNIDAPIQGWSSESKVISDYNGRQVSASYYVSSNYTPSSGVPVNFDTKIFDSHGAVTTGVGTWIFTAPVSGVYDLECTMTLTGSSCNVYATKNGTDYAYLFTADSSIKSGSLQINLNAGDTVSIEQTTGTTILAGSAPYYTHISISLNSGSQQITAGERVFAKYKLASDTAISANDPLPNDTKVKDTHGAYNTTTKKFVVPANGDYRITATAYQSGGAVGISVYADRNGTDEGIILHYNSSYFPSNGSMVVTDCMVGDELSAKADGATTLDAVNNGHQCTWITFEKLN